MKTQIQLIDTLIKEGNYKKAEDIVWGMHKANPSNLQIKKLLALVLLLEKNYVLSEKYYIEVMNEMPNDYDVNCNLAYIYSANEEFSLCEKFALNANNINDKHPASYLHLAELSMKTRQFEKAKQILDKCIEIYGGEEKLMVSDKDTVRVKNNYRDALLGLKNTQAAIDFLRKLNLDDKNRENYGENVGENFYVLIDIDVNVIDQKDIEELHKIINKKYPTEKSEWRNKVGALYALGSYYDKKKDKNESEKFFDLANKLVLKRQRFVPMGEQKLINNLIKNYVEPDILPASDNLNKGQGIIFITGLPRSGTTLLESILSTNPHTESGGELISMTNLCRSLIEQNAFQFEKSNLKAHIELIGDKYLNRVSYIRKDKKYFIDKLPGNYFNAYFISKILPAAKIINLKRDLWDVAVSAYKRLYINNVAYSSNFFYIICLVI